MDVLISICIYSAIKATSSKRYLLASPERKGTCERKEVHSQGGYLLSNHLT